MTNPLRTRTRPPVRLPAPKEPEAPKKVLCDLTADDYPTTIELVLPVEAAEGRSTAILEVDAFDMRGVCKTLSDDDSIERVWENIKDYLSKLGYQNADLLTEKHYMKIWSKVIEVCEGAMLFFFRSPASSTEEDKSES